MCLIGSVFLMVPVFGSVEEGESNHEEPHYKNEIAIFLGLTHEGRRDNSGAVGLEYERRINDSFGIGALAEFTAGDSDFWVYAISLTFHADRWNFVLAPGVEDIDGHTESLIRLGAGYEHEVRIEILVSEA